MTTPSIQYKIQIYIYIYIHTYPRKKIYIYIHTYIHTYPRKYLASNLDDFEGTDLPFLILFGRTA